MSETTDTNMTESEAAYERIEESLTNVTPGTDQIERIEHLRENAKALAWSVTHNCQSSRERSLALTHLEETVMWAVKSIVLE